MTILNKDVDTLGYSKQKEFTIELRPTSKCNYQCYYCTDLHINSNPVIPLNVESVQKLITFAREKTKLPIHVFICGGEPTLYSDIRELILKMLDVMVDDDHITLQSNMTKDIKWFEEFVSHVSGSFLFNGSYHNTQPVSFTDFIKKCMLLKSHDMLGMISFGYNKHKCVLNDYKKACRILGDNHCEVTPLINASVDQDPEKGNTSGDDIDYLFATQDMKQFQDYGHFFQQTLPYEHQSKSYTTSRAEMWLYRKNNFLSYKCDVSRYKIYVDWDGNCFRCFNEQFSPGPPSFHIDNTADMKYYFSSMKCMDCPFTTCFFDLEYKKTKQHSQIQEIKIDRKYNTHEERKKAC